MSIPTSLERPSDAPALRRAVLNYLADCFRHGQSPHVAELAQRLDCTPLSLGRRFRRAAGVHLSVFFRARQIARARRLLRWTGKSLADVARACGYATERSFFRAFRRSTGMSPAQFRAKNVRRRSGL